MKKLQWRTLWIQNILIVELGTFGEGWLLRGAMMKKTAVFEKQTLLSQFVIFVIYELRNSQRKHLAVYKNQW